MSRALSTLVLVLAGFVATAGRATATGSDGVVPASNAKAKENDGIEPKVGGTVPLDAEFRGEKDQVVTLRQCIAGKPTILVPMYYRCPKLCNVVLDELVKTLRAMPDDYTVGGKFNVICLSFDPKERKSLVGDKSLSGEKKASTLAVYGRPNAEGGWHFLTGDKDSIQACMDAIGYKNEYDRVFKEYNHPSGLIILTPEGKIARYFYGIDFDKPRKVDPLAEIDAKYLLPGGMTTLRLSLVEASDGKIGSLVDQIAILCSSFEYGKGYTVKRAVQIGGVITLLGVGTWVGLSLRRERRRTRESNPPHDAPPSGGTT
jgi:protein SCO1